jgi:hypothetical protein
LHIKIFSEEQIFSFLSEVEYGFSVAFLKQNGEAKQFLYRYAVHRVKGQLGDKRQDWDVATPK